MSRRRKSSNDTANPPRKVVIQMTPEMKARHHEAASKIIDIILGHCDGPADALFLLHCIATTLREESGIANISGIWMGSERIQ